MADPLSTHISEKLDQVSTEFPDCCIAKVPKHLPNVNEKPYAPQVVAIGPYHHHEHHLEVMEKYKLHYLKMLLIRRKENNVTRYVAFMRTLAARARACYDDLVSLSEDDFVEMLLIDACFIVELFRKCLMLELGVCIDPILNPFWMKKKLRRDLLLFENQLPFFILQEFFDMTVMPNENNNFLEMILVFFTPPLPNDCLEQNIKYSIKEIKHLLCFIHNHWVSRLVGEVSISVKMPILKKLRRSVAANFQTMELDLEFISCATVLQEAGIKFKVVEGDILFGVEFENGIMKISRLRIDDDTESFFRNLIVYEQFYPQSSNPVIDYMKFMDYLVNTAKDVKLLCQHKILINCLGDDEVVANMFNRLGDSVTISSHNRYRNIFKDVNNHCRRRRNKWMTNLRSKYFNTPWAFISFFAAVLLLLLTLVQTVFSVLSYFKS